MNTPAYVGLRFSLGKKKTRYLSFITTVSLVGLTLGIMSLIVVVSVMNGFDAQLKYRLLGAIPHMVSKDLPPNNELIVASAPFLEREGMIVYGGVNRLVKVYGIDPAQESKVSILPDHITSGDLSALQPGSHKVVLGSPMVRQMGVWQDQALTLMIPEPSPGGKSVLPRVGVMKIGGTFQMNSEVDYGLVLVNLQDLQQLIDTTDVHYRLKLADIFSVPELRQQLGDQVITDWQEAYGDFFATVKMEKIMMFVLLSLIVAVAAFNTVSGLSMMVRDKQAEIAVLRTMGLTHRDILTVFLVQGSLIGILGTLFGVVLGIPLAANISEVIGFIEDRLNNRLLEGTYFSRVPSEVRMDDILVIILLALTISVLAALYPAWQASRLNPASVLRSS